jgi:hypothetical protein
MSTCNRQRYAQLPTGPGFPEKANSAPLAKDAIFRIYSR